VEHETEPLLARRVTAERLGNRNRAYSGTLGLQVLAIVLTTTHNWLDNQLTDPILSSLTLILIVSLAIQWKLRDMALRDIATKQTTFKQSQLSNWRTKELFGMTDMLQAAETYDDAGAVLMATARRLMPDHGVALYVFNNSRDRLDLARSWDLPEGYDPSPALSPGNCWALKRGKTHVNAPSINGLCCAHHSGTVATVEIPMMACGQLHGLLVLARDGAEHTEDAKERVREVSRLGRSLADSMSLALSNIALREKLRTQSLRDPLTGLYNRRYMEDALERFVSLGSRTGGSTAVIMLDLDDFKKLNDAEGHAKGDAVLRDVAAQIVGALRPTDVICRYGGEELVAILPDCSLEDAMEKAEILRERIESLSASHECPISASLGVATVPETATSATDILPIADAALYAAKKAGKNCVLASDKRSGRGDAPRLAAISARQS
jgi:diguanylate cyclase (GGDEF)-like protein